MIKIILKSTKKDKQDDGCKDNKLRCVFCVIYVVCNKLCSKTD